MKKINIPSIALLSFFTLLHPIGLVGQEECEVELELEWNCFGENSGWAVVESVTGATNPTDILWSTGETVQFISGLPNGEHWVMVTDANGCWDKEFFTIACPVGCMIDFTLDQGCDEGQGWAMIDGITGAMGMTNILWSTGETTSGIEDLENGEYWVMVTDAENCWHKEYFYIGCPSDDCELMFTVDHGCEAEGDGWATVENITGATGTTNILWSSGENTSMITDLGSGDHWVMVTDSEGCWYKDYFTLNCPPLECEVEMMVSWGCTGENDGWAVIEQVTGATNPTTILWSTGENVQFITGLPNGEHWVMVTDADGCWDKDYFTLNCPGDDCVIDFDLDWGCTGVNDGWAEVENITGAVGETTILWSNDETDEYVYDLSNGEYWVMVMDSEGCWEKEYFYIDCEGGEEEPCDLRTQTMGGWGAPANGNNPGVYRDAYFDAAFPAGLTIGCDNTLMLTSAEAVEEFLPSGGQPQQLDGNMTDPGNYNNTLAGQLVALTLSVGFDANDDDFGSGGLLSNAVINNGMFEDWTVQQLLDEANAFIGGCTSSYTASELNEALSMVNENFVDGDTNEGNVDCAPMDGERMLLGGDDALQVRTYPVPATTSLNVDVLTDRDGFFSMVVMDALGRTVLQQTGEVFSAGQQRTVTLDLNSLNNGSYMLNILQNGVIMRTDRIVISR
ncbi:MAG: T9SS type A sorting domain-containing protein [Bacteroidota bacterium]|nr:T9SS type A sorting domain-containing protein [Bacteroidota bacterium]